MSTTTVGIAQWHAICGEPRRNLDTALTHIGSLAARGCELIVLPELWASGYDAASLADDAGVAAEPLDGERGRELAAAASQYGVWLFAGSVPEIDRDGRLFNTAVVYGPDGSLRARHRKVHLYTPLAEDDVFTAGSEPTVVDVDGIGTVGLSICFDGDHPEYARALHDLGARVVISVSAYETATESWWDILYPANALANGQWWLMANQSGGEGPNALLGCSRIIAPDGAVTAEAPRWDGNGNEAYLLVAALDLTAAVAAAEHDAGALWAPSAIPVRR
ncbi:MAG: carbon-nitrogen hydrolase family protein [Mycobacterium sp.]